MKTRVALVSPAARPKPQSYRSASACLERCQSFSRTIIPLPVETLRSGASYQQGKCKRDSEPMIYCSKCGRPDQETDSYCRHCGEFLVDLSSRSSFLTRVFGIS